MDNMADNLRDILKPGDTLETVCFNVDRTGENRSIRCIANDNGIQRDVSHMVAEVLGLRCDKSGAVRVRGTGMDMGFWLTYTLSAKLYGYENRGGYAIRHGRG
jgi:hypothetical protein